MTPQNILTRASFGESWVPTGSWAPARRKQSFRGTEPDPFDLKSLQEIVPEERPTPEKGRESEYADNQLSAAKFPTFGEGKVAQTTAGRLAPTLGETAGNILGENGIRRFGEFVRYERGWDLGSGEPLSSRSVAFVNAFLNRLPELGAFRPSLFLTHEGNLQLGWEDREGNTIEIEFGPDKVEYYLQGSGEERTIGLEALPQLILRIRSLVS
jgi:hypothetical protein